MNAATVAVDVTEVTGNSVTGVLPMYAEDCTCAFWALALLHTLSCRDPLHVSAPITALALHSELQAHSRFLV